MTRADWHLDFEGAPACGAESWTRLTTVAGWVTCEDCKERLES